MFHSLYMPFVSWLLHVLFIAILSWMHTLIVHFGLTDRWQKTMGEPHRERDGSEMGDNMSPHLWFSRVLRLNLMLIGQKRKTHTKKPNPNFLRWMNDKENNLVFFIVFRSSCRLHSFWAYFLDLVPFYFWLQTAQVFYKFVSWQIQPVNSLLTSCFQNLSL